MRGVEVIPRILLFREIGTFVESLGGEEDDDVARRATLLSGASGEMGVPNSAMPLEGFPLLIRCLGLFDSLSLLLSFRSFTESSRIIGLVVGDFFRFKGCTTPSEGVTESSSFNFFPSLGVLWQ